MVSTTAQEEINKYSNISSWDYYIYANTKNNVDYFELEIIKVNIYMEAKCIFLPFKIPQGIVQITALI